MRNIWQDRSGNFGILTALMIVPLFGAAGVALDIGQAMAVKEDLQQAADAAALAAVSKASPQVEAARKMASDGKIDLPDDQVYQFFATDKVGREDFDVDDATVSVIKKDNMVMSSVTFKATVRTTLTSLLGKEFTTVSGSATAKYQTEAYSDFYLLLDNSPSMGVGATPQDVATMVANTPDKCAFACHVVVNGVDNQNSYYHLAKKLGVTTRINVVAQATVALMDTATALRKASNQYRMAVYTFGEKAEDPRLLEVSPLSADLATAKKNAAKIDLMSAISKKSEDSMLTDFDSTLTLLSAKMGTPGTGASSASPDKVVFFVSDGLGDSHKPSSCTKKTAGAGRCQEPIDTKFCSALKSKGYKIAVLYTTYLPLPTDNWYNTWVDPFHTEIATHMQDCATPGLYFEVSPTEGISDAMSALFKKVITAPRLTS